VTNSATSNYWQTTEMDGETPKEGEIATRCYKHLDPQTKHLIDNFLSKQGV